MKTSDVVQISGEKRARELCEVGQGRINKYFEFKRARRGYVCISLGYHHKKIDKVDNTGTTKICIGITALLNTTTLTLSRIAAVIYQTYR